MRLDRSTGQMEADHFEFLEMLAEESRGLNLVSLDKVGSCLQDAIGEALETISWTNQASGLKAMERNVTAMPTRHFENLGETRQQQPATVERSYKGNKKIKYNF